MATRCIAAVVLCILSIRPMHAADDANYDPLAEGDAALPEPLDLVVHDSDQSRDVSILVYLPADKAPAPVVLFSTMPPVTGVGGASLTMIMFCPVV